MMGHTKTPWETKVAGPTDFGIYGADGSTVIECVQGCAANGGVSPIADAANAERIVHCVNAFDDVAGALEKLTDAYAALLIMKAEDPSRFQEPGSPYAEAKRILVTLSRARGEAS